MDAGGLRDYHERTKHSPRSVRRGGHFLDWGNEPAKLKVYPDLEPVALPPPPVTGVPCHEAIRRSSLARGEATLSLPALSHLLFHAAGVSRVVPTTGGPYHFRTYASAGALYPVEVYVAAGPAGGMEAGLYHYAPAEHALRRLRDADVRGSLGLAGEPPGAATVILTGIPWRTAWKYTARGFRHLYWDGGMIVANLLSAAAALDMPARLLLGFVDARVEEAAGVDGRTEFPLALVAVGRGDPPPPVDLPPLAHPVEPLSPRPTRDPEIEAARERVRIDTEEGVRAFRDGLPPPVPDPGGEPVPLGPTPEWQVADDGFEDVVRRRGSSRRLARESLPASEYAAIMDEALAPLPGDWRPGPREVAVVASALEGIAPGAYGYVAGEGFRLVRRGPFRREAGYLCLEQRLGADAAATTFLLAHLDGYLEALGGRGYAAAQLEAAVAAGRMYLGAYAQCLGASGITFYDDEVREFFGTGAEPMMAVVMGPEGRRRSIRRCRERRR